MTMGAETRDCASQSNQGPGLVVKVAVAQYERAYVYQFILNCLRYFHIISLYVHLVMPSPVVSSSIRSQGSFTVLPLES